jgi:hypothetical protein
MFDDLRDRSMEEMANRSGMPAPVQAPQPERRVIGMTAAQRLVISVMLLATVFILGLMCLLVTGRIWLV